MATWAEEWGDVEPIPQDEGPRPAVPIAYTAEFVRVMGVFRAALARDERSGRSLRLTQRVILHNAANYTAWHFRRLCLEALGEDLEAEMEYLDELAEDNAKNYQLWHHRRWVAQSLGTAAAARELRFSEDNLVHGDSKNYHIWSHRQWVLRELGGATWQQELAFCGRLLELDAWNNSAWNNSAWNQRMFALTVLLPRALWSAADGGDGGAGGTEAPLTTAAEVPGLRELPGAEEAFREEVGYTVAAAAATPENESAWAYLGGLARVWGKALRQEPAVVALCREVVKGPGQQQQEASDGGGGAGQKSGKEEGEGPDLVRPGVRFALSMLLEILAEGAEAADVAAAAGVGGGGPASAADVATAVCERLKEVDKMRWNYWEMRRRLFSRAG